MGLTLAISQNDKRALTSRQETEQSQAFHSALNAARSSQLTSIQNYELITFSGKIKFFYPNIKRSLLTSLVTRPSHANSWPFAMIDTSDNEFSYFRNEMNSTGRTAFEDITSQQFAHPSNDSAVSWFPNKCAETPSFSVEEIFKPLRLIKITKCSSWWCPHIFKRAMWLHSHVRLCLFLTHPYPHPSV